MRVYVEPAKSLIASKVVAALLCLPLFAWVFMLLLGAVHSDALEWVPPLGYWPSFLVWMLLGQIGTRFSGDYEMWHLRQGFKAASEARSIL